MASFLLSSEGGTCLIACLGSEAIHAMGYQFLIPTAFGSKRNIFDLYFDFIFTVIDVLV